MKVLVLIVLVVLTAGCSKRSPQPAKHDSVRPSTSVVNNASIQKDNHSTFLTTDIEGTYEGRHHSSIPDEVLVEAIDSNTVKVQIDGFGGEPNPNGLGGGLYSGIGTGVGKLTNDSVLIVIDTVDPDVAPLGCSFTLMFKDKHRLYVKHNGGSGSFGDVDASGLYRRVKKGKPKFDD